MAYVWEYSKQAGSDLLTLLAIADWTRDDGTHAYPTVPMLAAKTRLSTRSIQRIIVDLEAAGEITIKRSPGRGFANVYSVIMGDKLSPDRNDANVKGDTGGKERVTSEVEKGDTTRLTNRQEPLLEPSTNIYPAWVEILLNINGKEPTLKALQNLIDWVAESKIPAATVEQGLRDLKVEQPKRNYKDIARAARNWISNAHRWGQNGTPSRGRTSRTEVTTDKDYYEDGS
jgi:hypothetical protein